jgi:hypothetical protein
MTSISRLVLLRVLFAAVAAAALALLLGAEDRPSAAPQSLAKALEGVWVFVGEPGNVSAPPRAGGRFKFRIDQRWTFTSVDPVTHTVRSNFGGAYRVVGKEYFETVDYSTDADDPELGKTLKFIVKVEGDTMTQTGVGNSYTEVWKRVQ